MARLRDRQDKAVVDVTLPDSEDALAQLTTDERRRLRDLAASMVLSFDVLRERHPKGFHAFLALQ